MSNSNFTGRTNRSAAEAWPREHAVPIHRYHGNGRIRGWLLAVFIGAALGALLTFNL